MSKLMLIDAAHPEETRVTVVADGQIEDFDFEARDKRQLRGNIYLAKVTRVEPSLQAAFVEYGGNRHGFLAFSEIHPDYYQIPAEDREALLREEEEAARNHDDDDDDDIEDSNDNDASDEDDGDDENSSRSQNNDDDDQVSDDSESDDDDSDSDDDSPARSSRHRVPISRRYKIQEVIKRRQVLLIQVVKEERGNKGAAVTTYLSLAGRYGVLMPNTARGGGISRKITNASDRKRLKTITRSFDVPNGMGLIIRTAGAKRTKAEISRDYDYLVRLWKTIRDKTLNSSAPCLIHEEGDLVLRAVRDLYDREVTEINVQGHEAYKQAAGVVEMLMPDHKDLVVEHSEKTPLFIKYGVEAQLDNIFSPVVTLPSGGYIVINQTEALVAIDVNSGKATKKGSIEETALQTNLEAADEVARQLRLRDLAGLIVIDFIDMDERKNNAAVEKRLKERLKTDRARIQVGRISGFGLLEMSRQRLRPGMIEASTQPCPHCHGTGLIRSDDSMALSILRQIEEEGTRQRSREVLVRAPVGIANFLINQKREHVAQIEQRFGLSVRIEGDPALVSPDFTLEKFKTATRVVPEPVAQFVSGGAALMEEIDSAGQTEEIEEDGAAETAGTADSPDKPKKKRRRSRSRKRKPRTNGEGAEEATQADAPQDAPAEAGTSAEPVADSGSEPAPEAATPAPRKRTRSRKSPAAETAEAAVTEPAMEAEPEPEGEAGQAPRRRTVSRRKKAEAPAPVEASAPEAAPLPEPVAEPVPLAAAEATPAPRPPVEDVAAPVSEETATAEATVADPAAGEAEAEPEAVPVPEEAPKPKRRGWWSFG